MNYPKIKVYQPETFGTGNKLSSNFRRMAHFFMQIQFTGGAQ